MKQQLLSLITSSSWQDYELLDSGNLRKFERFGAHKFIRPEPQAMWHPRIDAGNWQADGIFVPGKLGKNDQEEGEGGGWQLSKELPASWQLRYQSLRFLARPTPFRHLGFFPDQSPHWLWASKKIQRFIQLPTNNDPPKILNLFGYSGLASLHAAYNGASVTHVDASKKAINYAFENRNLSSLQHLPIKFITDDAIKFVQREIRRNNKYDAVILDPPKYGRGPNGEKWELFKDLPSLLTLIPQVLSTNPTFVILNSYAIRCSYLSLHHALKEVMQNFPGQVHSGELSIKEKQSNPRQISTAIFARWESL